MGVEDCARAGCPHAQYVEPSGERSIFCTAHGGRLAVEVRRLQKENAELREWIRLAPHRRTCNEVHRGHGPCNCGRDRLSQDPGRLPEDETR